MKLFDNYQNLARFGLLGLLLSASFLACEAQNKVAETAPAAQKTPLKTVVLGIEGMVCDACAQSISATVLKLDGVEDCATSYAEKSARIVFAPDTIQIEKISLAIQDLGYQTGLVKNTREATKRSAENDPPPKTKDKK